MFSKYLTLFSVLNVFMFCESGLVDKLTKCEINDKGCPKKMLQNLLKDLSESGAPEMGLQPLDPMELKNITVKVLDILELNLLEGTAKGIKSCVIDKFNIAYENKHAFLEISCEKLSIKGKYKLFSASPLLKNILNADSLRGDGNGKIKLEKASLKFDFDFSVQKQDGEYYIKDIAKNPKYDYDVKKVAIFGDGLYLGDVESSKVVLGLLNENWRFLLTTFGKPFMDQTMQEFLGFIQKFLDGIPAKYFISGDLSSYA